MSCGEALRNGGFIGHLNNWTLQGAATYDGAEGASQLGAARLVGAGTNITQPFTAPETRNDYRIELWAKGDAATTITASIFSSDGLSILATVNEPVTVAWSRAIYARVGLYAGQYQINIKRQSADCWIDDVSLAPVVKTRAELAAAAAALLGDLATADASYSAAESGADSEGDYTLAVDAGLRAVGAVDDIGRPDPRCLEAGEIDAAISEIEQYMLNKLHRYYARHATDFSIGDRTEHYQQRVGAIERLLGLAVGGRPAAAGRTIQQRALTHRRP